MATQTSQPPAPAQQPGAVQQNVNLRWTNPLAVSPNASSSNLPSSTASAGSRPASSGSRASGTPVLGHLVPGANASSVPSPQFPPPGHSVSPPLQQTHFNYNGAPNAAQNGHYSQSPHPPHAPSPTHPPMNHMNPQQPGPQVPAPSQHHHRPASTAPTAQHPPPRVQGDVPQPTQAQPAPKAAASVQDSPAYHGLSAMIASTDAGVVRQVIRDYWEKAILGSQYHIAFLLNATIHQANNETLSRAVKDFGARMVRESKEDIVRHLKTEDLDEVVDLLLPQLSPNFLDKALSRRLETIPARQLVNALARAERLGYDVRDIVKEGQGGGEHVIPSLHALTLPSQPSPLQVPALSSQVPTPTQTIAPATQLHPKTQTPSNNPPIAISALPNLVYCQCGWPCSSKTALEYHTKKHCCYTAQPSDQVGKELCPHCGLRFISGGGLTYHSKVNVCGTFTDEQTRQITSLVNEFRRNNPTRTQVPTSTPAKTLALPALPKYSSPSDRGSPSVGDPYSNLTPQQRAELEAEMARTEEYYGNLMREATKLPEPEQSKQMAALKNRYNTKQSVTRKKYGVRLRERRSKAEIDAERYRLFGTVNGPSLSGQDGSSHISKKARATQDGQSIPTAQPNESQANTPRKRVPVNEMGGLSGSQATAEMNDPTASLNPVQPRQVPQELLQSAPRSSGTEQDPMSIDDDSDGSESDDEDIPASRPVQT